VLLTVYIFDTASVLTGTVAVTGNVLYLYVVHVSNLTLTLTLGYSYRSENKG